MYCLLMTWGNIKDVGIELSRLFCRETQKRCTISGEFYVISCKILWDTTIIFLKSVIKIRAFAYEKKIYVTACVKAFESHLGD